MTSTQSSVDGDVTGLQLFDRYPEVGYFKILAWRWHKINCLRITKCIHIHPNGKKHVYTKCHGNPSLMAKMKIETKRWCMDQKLVLKTWDVIGGC